MTQRPSVERKCKCQSSTRRQALCVFQLIAFGDHLGFGENPVEAGLGYLGALGDDYLTCAERASSPTERHVVVHRLGTLLPFGRHSVLPADGPARFSRIARHRPLMPAPMIVTLLVSWMRMRVFSGLLPPSRLPG